MKTRLVPSKAARACTVSALSAAALLLSACGGSSSSSEPLRPPTANNQFYSMTNTTANSVVHLNQNADGSLSVVNTVATGGAGSNGLSAAGTVAPADSLSSQYSVITAPDHRTLFAVNAGNGTVSSFHIERRTGDLVPLGTAISGAFPVSLAYANGYLYVLSQGNAVIGTAPMVSIHPVYGDGSVGSATPVSYAGANQPTEILATPDGSSILVFEKGAGKILSFPVLAAGQLGTPAVTSLPSFAAPFAGTFANSSTLLVDDAGNQRLQSFSFHAGTLTAIGTGVGPLPGAPCWLAITPNGAFAYAGLGSGQIASYAVGSGGTLTLLNAFAANEGLAVAGDSTISADGKYLYSTYLRTGTIIAYAIQGDGSLVKVGSPATVTSGTTMQGLAGF